MLLFVNLFRNTILLHAENEGKGKIGYVLIDKSLSESTLKTGKPQIFITNTSLVSVNVFKLIPRTTTYKQTKKRENNAMKTSFSIMSPFQYEIDTKRAEKPSTDSKMHQMTPFLAGRALITILLL